MQASEKLYKVAEGVVKVFAGCGGLSRGEIGRQSVAERIEDIEEFLRLMESCYIKWIRNLRIEVRMSTVQRIAKNTVVIIAGDFVRKAIDFL